MRQFRPPYAFKDTWQEIVADMESSINPTPIERSYTQLWASREITWPCTLRPTTYLGAGFRGDEVGQQFTAQWDTARYHDVVDTLDEIPGTSVLKAIIQADTYRTYRQTEIQTISSIIIDATLRPVLSENKPLAQQVSRYKRRENVPEHSLWLPFISVNYIWTPMRDAFLADYSSRPTMLGSPAEVLTDDFFDIVRSLARLIKAKEMVPITDIG